MVKKKRRIRRALPKQLGLEAYPQRKVIENTRVSFFLATAADIFISNSRVTKPSSAHQRRSRLLVQRRDNRSHHLDRIDARLVHFLKVGCSQVQ